MCFFHAESVIPVSLRKNFRSEFGFLNPQKSWIDAQMSLDLEA